MVAYTKTFAEKWTALYVRLSRDDENEGDSNSISHQQTGRQAAYELEPKFLLLAIPTQAAPFFSGNQFMLRFYHSFPAFSSRAQPKGRHFLTECRPFRAAAFLPPGRPSNVI